MCIIIIKIKKGKVLVMAKSYEITFVNGIKVIQRLTQVQLYDIIRKYKVRGYKLI